MLIILVRYQRVANKTDVPFSGAQKGGGVNRYSNENFHIFN